MKVETKIIPKSRDEFIQAMNNYATQMKKDMQKVLIHQSALACIDAMKFTPPMPKGGGRGLTKAAFKTGEKSVERDIKSIAVAMDDRKAGRFMYFRAVCNSLYSGDKASFEKLMYKNAGKGIMTNNIFYKIANDYDTNRAFNKAKNLFAKYIPRHSDYGTDHVVQDIDEIHERILRTKNGRIVRNGGPGFNWLNKYLVQSKETLKAYIKKRQQMVGKLKSGWVGALRSLPSIGYKKIGGDIPSWLTKHSVVNGYSSYSMNDSSQMYVRVGNRIGDNDGVATDADTPNIVYGSRVKQMEASVRDYMNKNINKFNNQN